MVIRKLLHWRRMVKGNGGLRRSLYALFVRDDLKDGRLVGEDDYGNKYYENNKYFFGRNRWVNYADHVYLDYDASQVAPEWSGWLHYRTDLPPGQDPSRPRHPWMSPHVENMTGTRDQYVPWSTTLPKVHAWQPHRKQTRDDGGQGDDCSCCARFRQPRPQQSDDDDDDEDPPQCDVEENKKPTPGPCEKPATVFH